MKAPVRLLLPLMLAAATAGCAAGRSFAPPPATGTTASAALATLVEDYFDEMLALDPVTATLLDDHRYDDRLADSASRKHAEAGERLERRYLEAALAVDPAALDERDRLTREIFLRERREAIAESRFPERLLPVSQQSGLPLLLPILGNGQGPQPFATVDDYDRWIRRASQFPAWVDTAIAALREGMAVGVTQPRVTMEKVVPQLDALIADAPMDSEFFGPVEHMPATFPPAEQARLRAALESLIVETLNPSYARLRDFIRDEYIPACRASTAWSALPDGASWYRHKIAVNTTTGLAAGEIHAIGLAEVARIRGEMEQVARDVGFTGDLAAFFRFVQSDPRFFFDDPQALIDGYAEIKQRVSAALPRLFERLPEADFEVRAVESFRAEAAAGASYQRAAPDGSRPGVFYVNTWNLMAQPKYGMETLLLHEALPGHHFQISIQQALEGQPRFRRFAGYVGYTEGWAMYAESLGPELGLFREPMQYYGRLNDEMLRAMRLVVDTGLHALGWSREQAIGYMQANSSLAESDIVAEVERYIVWPGQALGYKIGDLRIQAARRRAEAALGDRFDLRAFHTEILRDGALPLDVLDAKIDRWIASLQAGDG